MSPGEQLVLNDANEFIRQTSNLIDEAEQSTGIRPHPVIEESETVLETTRFGMQFAPEPLAEVEPVAGGPPTPAPACPSPTVTFNIGYGCCLQYEFGTGWNSFVDNTLNGVPYTAGTATDCAGLDCFWPFASCGTVTGNHFDSDSTCTDTPTSTATYNAKFAVGKLGSTWYVIVVVDGFFTPNVPVLFLGSGTDPSTIVSGAFCGIGNIDDNPLIECIYGGPLTDDQYTTFGFATITP